MIEDSELLRRYAEERSETAFAELVQRRVNLVYAVALRQCGGDAHLAEDVTQRVFSDLARKAQTLMARPVLSGWLYRSTQFAASDVVRAERRRRTREEENQIMNETVENFGGTAADWEKLRPVIDEAMGELPDADRDAVALRFFEGKSFGEIGARLSLAEDAARKRVERALAKLHAALARRGVTSTTAALGLALGNQVAASVPAGLAVSVARAATVAAGAAGWGVLTFMSTKLTMGLIGVVVVVGVGVALREANQADAERMALAATAQEQAALGAKVKAMEGRLQAQTARLSTAETENARLLATAEKMKTAATAAPVPAEAEPITSGMVNARYKRGQELARNGDPAEALRELLWCFDEGMPQVTSMTGVRGSFLLSAIAKLGERYPEAWEALRVRRDQAREKLLASESNISATQDFGSLNRVLKDDASNLVVLDQLPPGDQRRRSVAAGAYDYLVENHRYKDAAEGRPYATISSTFERTIQELPLPASVRNPDEIRKMQRDSVIAGGAKSVEVLAGAGDLEHAVAFAQRLLAYDNSEGTRALLQKHAERAGQPGLLAGLLKP